MSCWRRSPRPRKPSVRPADGRRALRAARRGQRQEAVHAKVAELQAKLHPPMAPASKS